MHDYGYDKAYSGKWLLQSYKEIKIKLGRFFWVIKIDNDTHTIAG